MPGHLPGLQCPKKAFCMTVHQAGGLNLERAAPQILQAASRILQLVPPPQRMLQRDRVLSSPLTPILHEYWWASAAYMACKWQQVAMLVAAPRFVRLQRNGQNPRSGRLHENEQNKFHPQKGIPSYQNKKQQPRYVSQGVRALLPSRWTAQRHAAPAAPL